MSIKNYEADAIVLGQSMVFEDGATALEESQQRGPTVGVEWNPTTCRLELVGEKF
jgi:hypothetical protein